MTASRQKPKEKAETAKTYLSLAESNDAIFMSNIQDIDTLIETTPEIEVELKHLFDSLLEMCACSGSYEYTTVIEANNTNGKNNGDVSLDHSPRFAERQKGLDVTGILEKMLKKNVLPDIVKTLY